MGSYDSLQATDSPGGGFFDGLRPLRDPPTDPRRTPDGYRRGAQEHNLVQGYGLPLITRL
eukprot:2585231-Prymnesium_polylepis.1